jgi:hypothetical protein
LLTFVRILAFLACSPILLPSSLCACQYEVADNDNDNVPTNDSGHHAPGCPLICADRVPEIAQSGHLTTLDSSLPVDFFRRTFVVENDSPFIPISVTPPSDPPLFLSHCALVC